MNKTELISAAAELSDVRKKDAEQVLDAAFSLMAQALSNGERVQLTGFGTFEVKEREARVGRNPRTREPVEIPATRVVQFKPAKALKDSVAK